DAGTLGGTLADLHLAGLELGTSFAQPGIYTWDNIKKRIDDIRKSADPVLIGAAAVLDEEGAWIDARAALRAAEPAGIIHGDLFPDNVLFDGKSSWLIDFEQASSGSLVYDLAVCLNAWCFRDEFAEDLLAAMVRGYHGRRRLSPTEIQALHIELRGS